MNLKSGKDLMHNGGWVTEKGRSEPQDDSVKRCSVRRCVQNELTNKYPKRDREHSVKCKRYLESLAYKKGFFVSVTKVLR